MMKFSAKNENFYQVKSLWVEEKNSLLLSRIEKKEINIEMNFSVCESELCQMDINLSRGRLVG
jgi:hypothetical protein